MKHYLAALQGMSDINNVHMGNAEFQCDAPLTKLKLDEVKRHYCKQLFDDKGVRVNPDSMMFLAVIPLDA